MKKVIGIGVVVLLVGALVGSGAYLLLRDSGSNGGNASTGSGRGGQNQVTTTDAGTGGGRWNSEGQELTAGAGGGRWNSAPQELATGTGGGRWNSVGDVAVVERGGRGTSGTAADLAVVQRGGGNAGTVDRVSGESGSGYRGGNTAAGAGTGTPEAAVTPEDWLTVSGVVVEMEEELVVRTADGEEIVIGLGPSHYRDASGVTIAVGDTVQVSGFHEDGEFKAGTVENLSSGQVLALRDESGRPFWSGRGRQGQ